MKTLAITPNQVERARKLYPFDELNGSITKGKSNIYGALGEVIINDYFVKNGYSVDFNSTYDYDIIIDGWKVDVKTKRTTVTPQDHYLCSISSWNIKQKCDLYMFVRINENMKNGYLLGFKGKDEFFKSADFKKKGELDINGWSFKDDCYNLKVSELRKLNN